MFAVEKIGKAFAVVNWKGDVEIAYKNRKFAEQYADGARIAMMNEAEDENNRRDGIREYLMIRASRAPVVSAQLEMF